MNVTIDLCIVPLGVGVSVSSHIARCQEVLKAAGLEPKLHPFGTAVEGEWQTVMDAVRDCFTAMHEKGAPRVHATMRIGTRIDRKQTLEEKVESVSRRLTE